MLGKSLVIILVSILVGLYLNTFRSTPHVSEQQIQSDGGHALVHPDGHVTEYFLVGDPQHAPVLYFHGAGSTGRSCTFMSDYARAFEYRIIGVSTPGYGGSSPIPGRGYFEGARDAVALLDHLGYHSPNSVHVLGISFGSGAAAALAEIIPSRIISLSLVIPAWPSMSHYSIFQGASVAGVLLNAPILDRLYAYYIIKADISLKEVMLAIAPEEVEMVEKVREGIMDVVDLEYKRSTKYHHEGACELSRLLRSGGEEIYERMNVLREMGERVSVWVATKDAAANPMGPKFLKEALPAAKVEERERGHLEMVIYLEEFFEEMKRIDQTTKREQE